jgi:DNA-binding NarL/FixJ family response regulator
MRILIADDNAMIRRGISRLLASEAGWTICGESVDGATTIAQTRALNPDVVLLDVSLPDASGLDVARKLRAEFPAVKIILVSQNDAAQLQRGADSSGAHACVDKSELANALIPAIKSLP